MKDRIRKIVKLAHTPSGHGKGKWHTRRSLIRYKLQRRKLHRIARASRRVNRERVAA